MAELYDTAQLDPPGRAGILAQEQLRFAHGTDDDEHRLTLS